MNTWAKKSSKSKKGTAKRSFLSDIALFEQSEETFTDNGQRRRVYVHLVSAPWSRVILLSLVYAIAVAFAKIGWGYFFGRPEWLRFEPAIAPLGLEEGGIEEEEESPSDSPTVQDPPSYTSRQ